MLPKSIALFQGLFRKEQTNVNKPEPPPPPPQYKSLSLFGDLRKPTRDIFDNGCVLNDIKVTAKTSSDAGDFHMKTNVALNLKDGTFKGAEVEGRGDGRGMALTKTWNTDNVIGLAAEITDKSISRVIILKGSYCPHSGSGIKAGGISAQFKRCSLQFWDDGKKLDSSFVMDCKGWLAGGKLEYDYDEGALKNTSYAYALGHSCGSLHAVLLCENNMKDFTCNIYKRFGKRLEMGMIIASSKSNYDERKKIFYDLGARCVINDNISVRAKINHRGITGLGIELALPCINLMGSTEFDIRKLQEVGGIKFGTRIEIEM